MNSSWTILINNAGRDRYRLDIFLKTLTHGTHTYSMFFLDLLICTGRKYLRLLVWLLVMILVWNLFIFGYWVIPMSLYNWWYQTDNKRKRQIKHHILRTDSLRPCNNIWYLFHMNNRILFVFVTQLATKHPCGITQKDALCLSHNTGSTKDTIWICVPSGTCVFVHKPNWYI